MRSVLALCAVLGSIVGPCGALAQSYGAPAGRPAATAPGGTEGLAGTPNEERAIEAGDAVPAPPGVGVPVDPALPPAEERRLPPGSRP